MSYGGAIGSRCGFSVFLFLTQQMLPRQTVSVKAYETILTDPYPGGHNNNLRKENLIVVLEQLHQDF
jgi:hypothetical protein